ncbi:hypothetical protein BSU04_42560 [Caballeronia sordidicola]|uniref:Uncharacterized protein n=1 Tax=Caballeronia sordidicola TaxID=196367 RepID=A0A226WNB0_CABSO|nr:hypothetical protein BSU04_42560 [Caballeronia sordidicola]
MSRAMSRIDEARVHMMIFASAVRDCTLRKTFALPYRK